MVSSSWRVPDVIGLSPSRGICFFQQCLAYPFLLPLLDSKAERMKLDHALHVKRKPVAEIEEDS